MNKKVFLISCIISTIYAANDPNDLSYDYNEGSLGIPLLYKIHHPNPQVTGRMVILGSQHNVPREYLHMLTRRVASAADILVGEISGNQPQYMSDWGDVPEDLLREKKLFTPDNPDWVLSLPKKSQEILMQDVSDRVQNKWGLSVKQCAPVLIIQVLNSLIDFYSWNTGAEGMDIAFETEFQQAGKTLIALENGHDRLVSTGEIETICAARNDFIDVQKLSHLLCQFDCAKQFYLLNQLNRSKQSYQAEEEMRKPLHALKKFMSYLNPESVRVSTDLFVQKRNQMWLPKMLKIMEDNPDKNILFMFGHGHLRGETKKLNELLPQKTGVLDLLEAHYMKISGCNKKGFDIPEYRDLCSRIVGITYQDIFIEAFNFLLSSDMNTNLTIQSIAIKSTFEKIFKGENAQFSFNECNVFINDIVPLIKTYIFQNSYQIVNLDNNSDTVSFYIDLCLACEIALECMQSNNDCFPVSQKTIKRLKTGFQKAQIHIFDGKLIDTHYDHIESAVLSFLTSTVLKGALGAYAVSFVQNKFLSPLQQQRCFEALWNNREQLSQSSTGMLSAVPILTLSHFKEIIDSSAPLSAELGLWDQFYENSVAVYRNIFPKGLLPSEKIQILCTSAIDNLKSHAASITPLQISTVKMMEFFIVATLPELNLNFRRASCLDEKHFICLRGNNSIILGLQSIDPKEIFDSLLANNVQYMVQHYKTTKDAQEKIALKKNDILSQYQTFWHSVVHMCTTEVKESFSPESLFWQEVDLYLKHDQQPEPLYSFRDFLQTVLNRPSE